MDIEIKLTNIELNESTTLKIENGVVSMYATGVGLDNKIKIDVSKQEIRSKKSKKKK